MIIHKQHLKFDLIMSKPIAYIASSRISPKVLVIFIFPKQFYLYNVSLVISLNFLLFLDKTLSHIYDPKLGVKVLSYP